MLPPPPRRRPRPGPRRSARHLPGAGRAGQPGAGRAGGGGGRGVGAAAGIVRARLWESGLAAGARAAARRSGGRGRRGATRAATSPPALSPLRLPPPAPHRCAGDHGNVSGGAGLSNRALAQLPASAPGRVRAAGALETGRGRLRTCARTHYSERLEASPGTPQSPASPRPPGPAFPLLPSAHTVEPGGVGL